MTKPILPRSAVSKAKGSNPISTRSKTNRLRKRNRRSKESSDVLISAVISSYLLTHLHYVLQRAEYGAAQEGRKSQAANFAQLRKVLCMDARSMEDALATGMRDSDSDNFHHQTIASKAA